MIVLEGIRLSFSRGRNILYPTGAAGVIMGEKERIKKRTAIKTFAHQKCTLNWTSYRTQVAVSQLSSCSREVLTDFTGVGRMGSGIFTIKRGENIEGNSIGITVRGWLRGGYRSNIRRRLKIRELRRISTGIE